MSSFPIFQWPEINQNPGLKLQKLITILYKPRFGYPNPNPPKILNFEHTNTNIFFRHPKDKITIIFLSSRQLSSLDLRCSWSKRNLTISTLCYVMLSESLIIEGANLYMVIYSESGTWINAWCFITAATIVEVLFSKSSSNYTFLF